MRVLVGSRQGARNKSSGEADGTFKASEKASREVWRRATTHRRGKQKQGSGRTAASAGETRCSRRDHHVTILSAAIMCMQPELALLLCLLSVLAHLPRSARLPFVLASSKQVFVKALPVFSQKDTFGRTFIRWWQYCAACFSLVSELGSEPSLRSEDLQFQLSL